MCRLTFAGMGDENRYASLVRRLVAAVALVMALYHLWVAFVGPPNALVLRSVHIGFALTLAFSLCPGASAPRRGLAQILGTGR